MALLVLWDSVGMDDMEYLLWLWVGGWIFPFLLNGLLHAWVLQLFVGFFRFIPRAYNEGPWFGTDAIHGYLRVGWIGWMWRGRASNT